MQDRKLAREGRWMEAVEAADIGSLAEAVTQAMAQLPPGVEVLDWGYLHVPAQPFASGGGTPEKYVCMMALRKVGI